MRLGLAACLGAFLLFFIQPFIGKVITPSLGGSARVWLSCMVFFQALLLAGYGYAHILVKRGSARTQGLVHGGVLLLALAAGLATWQRSGQPFVPPAHWVPGAEAGTSILVIFGLLVRTVGLPFFALAATAPLTQAWFAGRYPGKDPFRLYALSNLGSLAGLLCYPFLAERWLTTGGQARAIFAMLGAFIALLAWAWIEVAASVAAPVLPDRARASFNWKRGGLWVLASATGAALLLGGTNHLTESIANIPLLWVIPFAIYLVTYIVWFESSWIRPGPKAFLWICLGFAASLLLLAWAQRQPAPLWPILAVNAVIGTGCLLVHGLLFSLRPDHRDLTAYYLLIAAGGVLGGSLVALGVPVAFNRLYEFPILVCACGLLGILWALRSGWPHSRWLQLASAVPLVLGLESMWKEASKPGQYFRDAYGVVSVGQAGGVKVLMHGNVLHGLQLADQPRRPLAFYTPAGGIGRAFSFARSRKRALRVGIVGLGIGSIATFAEPGDQFVFYEISPTVVRLSSGPHAYFDVLRSAPVPIEVQQGDGRNLLEKELRNGSRGFDLLVLDAFSGGQIPWHLLTVEAMATYFGHLAPEGILVVHASNRLAVDRILAANAQACRAWAIGIDHPSRDNPGRMTLIDRPTNTVLLARTPILGTGHLFQAATWIAPPPQADFHDPAFGGKTARGRSIADSVQPWYDRRNSLTSLILGPRPAFLE